MKLFKIYMVCVVLSFVACKEQFTPKTTAFDNNLLVVEGFINTGADSTSIKLSRTVILASTKVANPETGATISIETSANETRTLVERERGVYATPALNFGANKKYRVKIKTKNGANYISEFVDAVTSPPIDSVNFVVKPEGLQLYVNTGDPANKTHYYRWEYQETWIFYAQFHSVAIWKGGPFAIDRLPEEYIYKCWGNANSSTILLGSTVKLTKDVIHLSPLTDIEASSERLTEKYSILVRQYALNKETYEFWENLKKNTESLGSIFDVLPSQLTGNIRNVANNAEPVIGFISAGTMQEKRIFIAKDQLPRWTVKSFGCNVLDTVELKDQRTAFDNFSNIPVEPLYSPITNQLVGHTSAPRSCVDCTLRGTVRRPIFWQ